MTLAIMLATAQAVFAQNAPVAADQSAHSYDMKAQARVDLDRRQQKFVALAQAVPAEKFTWRPSEDSRSFTEVFLHVAAERYQILALMGSVPPEDFNGKTFEKSTTDKDKIVAELNRTSDFAQKSIKAMNNADFAKLLPNLGPHANAGDVVYILVADAHEHLGQLVAYARTNGIVPPWTVARKKGG
jgi:uncharacterized damage-inducible protein DinB